MDDEYAVGRLVVSFADVVCEVRVGGADALAVISHGEEALDFIYEDDVAVFVKDGHSLWGVFPGWARELFV